MCEQDRKWHKLFNLITCKSEHKSLVTSTPYINSEGNIRGLPVNRSYHSTCFIIEPVFCPCITNLFYHFPYNIRYLNVTACRDLTSYKSQSRCHKCLTCDPGNRIFRNYCIQYRI